MAQDKRLLIVDDDTRIGRLTQRFTHSLGYQTQVLDQPNAFEQVYQQFKPHLLLLDLKMDQRDGIEILRFLADQETPPAILLLSGMDEQVIHSARCLGESLGLRIPVTLQKPIELSALKRALESLQEQTTPPPSVVQLIALGELEDAIAHGQIVPYYQPQVNLHSLQVTGVEVLARWLHPQHGLLPPADFIGLAESTGLIEHLSFTLLRQALGDMNFLLTLCSDLTLSLNISTHLLDNLEFPQHILQLLEEYQFPTQRLVLEVTESGRVAMPQGIEVLTRLRLRGVGISDDDLGKGYAGVDQLYRLPFSELKVDREYVMESLRSDTANAIVRATIDLGRRMGLHVVAEGIENQATLELLRDLGCHTGQGLLFSPPLSLHGLFSWLERWKAQHPSPTA